MTRKDPIQIYPGEANRRRSDKTAADFHGFPALHDAPDFGRSCPVYPTNGPAKSILKRFKEAVQRKVR